ncbi:hypothetical protein ACH0CA_01365 [Kytococcus sedentarius]|uniref:hypothetical protein n=1 Tax=Kytococcus sedentarius TaxID=1276 RepID=UPI00387A30EB
MTTGSHPNCYPVHVCQEPSGRACYEPHCEEPAGTRWGPYWCPVHDKERLDRIERNLEDLAAALGTTMDGDDR